MQNQRDFSFHILIRGVVLIGFFLLLLKMIVTGDIQNFIAPKMIPYTYFSIIVLFILGVMQIWRSGSDKLEELYCNCGFDHNQNGSPIQSLIIYSLFLLPVLTGLIFPTTVLDSSIAAKRGVKFGSGLFTKPPENYTEAPDTSLAKEYMENPEAYMEKLDDSFTEDSVEESVADQDPMANAPALALTNSDKEKLKQDLLQSDPIVVNEQLYLPILDILHDQQQLFIGKKLEVIGFVYREPDFGSNDFVLARFGLSCCVADASVYGIMSTIENHQDLEDDQWVKATGILSTTTFHGRELPYLQLTQFEKIDQPANPYVYEVYTNLLDE